MPNIILKSTGVIKEYNPYFKPLVLESSINMPKMQNAGYNSFVFEGGENVNFTFEAMPEDLKIETNKFKFYETQIIVYRADKSTCSGTYYKTIEKETNKVIKETIDFS